MKHDESDHERVRRRIEELLPGSTTFDPGVVCPNCGWRFAQGLTDPTGRHTALESGAYTICGECLRILKFNEQLQPEVQTADMLKAQPREVQEQLASLRLLIILSRAANALEPKERDDGTL